MVEIYMALDGKPSAQQVILDLIASVYGEIFEAGVTSDGASLWVVETRTAYHPGPVTPAPTRSGTVHARLEDLVGIGKDPDRIHELVHGRVACGRAEELAAGGLMFIAEPEYVHGVVAVPWKAAA